VSTTYDLPLPGETFDGRTVIASTWVRDDEEPILALLMLLNPKPPYYTVASLIWSGGGWVIEASEDQPNINPATEAYSNQGGDY
jgi:hypothetical protein